MPGVDRRTAEGLVAEIGVDMTRFDAAGRLASWAGMCPGNNESARKHGPGRRGGLQVAPRLSARGRQDRRSVQGDEPRRYHILRRRQP